MRSMATSARRSNAIGWRSAIVATAFSSICRSMPSTVPSSAMTRRARPTSWRASASIESVTCFCASPPISATICVSLLRSLSKTRWVWSDTFMI